MAGTMGNALQASILSLILNATPISLIADNTATTPLTNVYVALHTADPTNAGNQTSSEIAYTNYARIAIARNAGSPAWTVTGTSPASASPNAAITFATSAGGAGGTVTYVTIGSLVSGTGQIFWRGAITPSIVVSAGTVPIISTATTVTLD